MEELATILVRAGTGLFKRSYYSVQFSGCVVEWWVVSGGLICLGNGFAPALGGERCTASELFFCPPLLSLIGRTPPSNAMQQGYP